MRSAAPIFIVALLVSSPQAGMAQSADAAEAKRIEDGIKTYGLKSWSNAGFTKVAPADGGYRLTFDFERGYGTSIAPWTVKRATPLAMDIKRESGDVWNISGKGPFSLSTELLAANRTNAFGLDIGKYEAHGRYDSAIRQLRTGEASLDDIKVTMRSSQDSIRANLTNFNAKSSLEHETGDAAGLHADFTASNLTITLGAFPNPEVKLGLKSVTGSSRLGKMNLAAIRDLTEFWSVAARGQTVEKLDTPQRERLRALMFKYSIPIDDFGTEIDAEEVSLRADGRQITANKMALDVAVQADGRSDILLGASDISLAEGAWPPGLKKAFPKKIDLRATYLGVRYDAMWADMAKVRTAAEQARLPTDHAKKVLYDDQPATMDITAASLVSDVYHIEIKGKILVKPYDPRQRAQFDLVVTARDFDRTVKFLQENAKTVPSLGQAAFVATMAKGLGKVEPGGSTVWNIKSDELGKITINGQQLPV